MLEEDDREKLLRSLGPHNKVLILQGGGGGALCCGATAEEAWLHARCIVAASEAQSRLAHVPIENLLLLPEESRKQVGLLINYILFVKHFLYAHIYFRFMILLEKRQMMQVPNGESVVKNSKLL